MKKYKNNAMYLITLVTNILIIIKILGDKIN
jgi:hypothetical protein